MWECVGDDEDEVLTWECVGDESEEELLHDRLEACSVPENLESSRRPLSLYSKEGRVARALLQTVSIAELRRRLRHCGRLIDDALPGDRDSLVELLLEAQGVEEVLVSMGAAAPVVPAPNLAAASRADLAPRSSRDGLDYSRFSKIDYGKEYGLETEDDNSKLPNLLGTPLEALEPFRALAGDLTKEERLKALEKIMRTLQSKEGLAPPPAPPAPECHPIAECAPPCEPDVYPASWLEPYGGSDLDDLYDDSSDILPNGRGNDEDEVLDVETDEVLLPSAGLQENPSIWQEGNAMPVLQAESHDLESASREEDATIDMCDEAACCALPDASRDEDVSRARIAERYNVERQKVDQQAHVLEAVDVDGWGLESPQFDLVEDAEEDLIELQVLLQCCDREDNRARLQKAIREFEVKLRVKRTWAWFPLTRWTWSGYEYEKPLIVIDFKVPGVGLLPADDIHCDFGTDWFDLKVWNVLYSDDPDVKYHHRVKKTRLMRDIVPSESFVQAEGDHIFVHLQKANEPRHGYCAWPELAAGKGRKPFKYNEEAPDGGLMDFFEGEYEKHEGYDGFRRDIGKAMEKIHRCEPIRGIDDSPIEEV